MANFDAMVPLIPKDVRIPTDHEREQLRINQIQKTQELEKISDEETNTITEHRQQQPHHQSQQQSAESDADEQQEGRDEDGHIDTYA